MEKQDGIAPQEDSSSDSEPTGGFNNDPAYLKNYHSSLKSIQELVYHFKICDTACDYITEKAEALNENLKTVRRCRDDFDPETCSSGRAQTIKFLQNEVKKLKRLEWENRELKFLLEDHQYALKLAMIKYQEKEQQLKQAQKAAELSKIAKKEHENSQTEDLVHRNILKNLNEKTEEMAAVMCRANELMKDSELQHKYNFKFIEDLQHDNQILREILTKNSCIEPSEND
ncbi:FGFR1 oncogene partner 2 homolog [Brevipalpus obovatus]|uniref:FGFR1 oncogene partner 2 homolog n=1 Tax=Brevipalpus obovatus TaxID=246614 RepID=UPI003D9F2196